MNYNFHGTTILCVKRNSQVVIGGDGQVTLGHSVIKSTANKVKRLYNSKIITGFAGSTADAFTLFEKLESKLESYQGNLTKSTVELAKEWRSDKMLRRLEAMLLVADQNSIFLLNGNGDVIEPEKNLIAIGSGGNYALAAASAMYENTDLAADQIVRKGLKIAADLCIYTNHHFNLEILGQ